jgi:hypothetical protein
VTPTVFAAAAAVIEAARENLEGCVYATIGRDGRLGTGVCGEPASFTVHSHAYTVCAEHAKGYGDRPSPWPHSQVPLLHAIAAYDQAVADAARETLGGK